MWPPLMHYYDSTNAFKINIENLTNFLNMLFVKMEKEHKICDKNYAHMRILFI